MSERDEGERPAFTPGPWRVGNLAPSFGARLDDGHDDYFGVAFSNVWGDGPGIGADPVGVARCLHRGDPARTVANARLIASAPDLLAACRKAMDACQDNLRMWQYKDEVKLMDAFEACKAAIARAEGKGTEGEDS